MNKELDREIDKAETHCGYIWFPEDGKLKTQALAKSGIFTREDNNSENLPKIPESTFEVT